MWVLLRIFHPELAMECFLPVPQFPPPKFGYCDTEPASSTREKQIETKLPYGSSLYFRFLLVLMPHHPLDLSTLVSPSAPQMQVENLLLISLSQRACQEGARRCFPLYPTAQECLLCRIARAGLLGTALGLEINPCLGCSMPALCWSGALGFCPSSG